MDSDLILRKTVLEVLGQHCSKHKFNARAYIKDEIAELAMQEALITLAIAEIYSEIAMLPTGSGE